MRLNPHLNFNGDCEAAFKFYERRLGAKISFIMTYGASPMAKDTPPGWSDKIMHATLQLGESTLTGNDVALGYPYNPPQGFSLTIETKDPAEAERAFAALADHGKVEMPLQETFWAVKFGVVIDRFGVPWMVNCAKAAQQPA